MEQRSIALLGNVKREVKLRPLSLISQLDSAIEALKFQVRESRLKQEYIAEVLGINRGHFSCMLSGSKHFPLNKIRDLNEVTNSCELSQYLTYQAGFDVVKSDMLEQQKEIERLREIVNQSTG